MLSHLHVLSITFMNNPLTKKQESFCSQKAVSEFCKKIENKNNTRAKTFSLKVIAHLPKNIVQLTFFTKYQAAKGLLGKC